MPKRVERIAYVGRDSLAEALLPEPTEHELAKQRLELENAELHRRLQHLEQALKAAATVLAPYAARLNGGTR